MIIGEQLCDALCGAISGERISLTISGGMWWRCTVCCVKILVSDMNIRVTVSMIIL